MLNRLLRLAAVLLPAVTLASALADIGPPW